MNRAAKLGSPRDLPDQQFYNSGFLSTAPVSALVT